MTNVSNLSVCTGPIASFFNRSLLKGLLALFAAVALTSDGMSFSYHLQDNGLRTKWYEATIPVNIIANDTVQLADGLTAARSVQSAVSQWNAKIGTSQFAPVIAPAAVAADGNGANDISFASTCYGQAFGANVVVVTIIHLASPDSDRNVEADIVLNTAYTWGSYRGNLNANPNLLDIERVVLRELGRVLGLDYQDSIVPSIMNSTISNTDALQADDIAGARSLYGALGGDPPANDNFSNAVAINMPGSTVQVTGTNVAATKEAGEPNYVSGGGRSVWWKWTATVAGNVRADTAGSAFDTIMGVFTGTSVSALSAICNNDDENNPLIRTSKVVFAAVPGTTYFIAVDGYTAGLGADHGPIVLNLSINPPANTAAHTGDFNKDGKADVLWRNSSTGMVASWTASGFMIFGLEDSSWKVIGEGDFDGDGKSDVLWREAATGLIAAWTSAGGFTTFGVEGGGWSVFGVADCDGDKKADVVWRNSTTGVVCSWTSGNGFVGLGTETANLKVIGVGDLNNDGKADLLWHDTSTGAVYATLTGGGSMAFDSETDGWQVLGIGDFNGDGKTDLLWHSLTSGAVRAELSTGAYAARGIEGDGWQAVGTGDFDHDGKTDVLWTNTASGLVASWLSAGGFAVYGVEGDGWSIVR